MRPQSGVLLSQLIVLSGDPPFGPIRRVVEPFAGQRIVAGSEPAEVLEAGQFSHSLTGELAYTHYTAAYLRSRIVVAFPCRLYKHLGTNWTYMQR